jgi:hypothetical protein
MVVKRDVYVVYLASRDAGVPWYAKLVALLVIQLPPSELMAEHRAAAVRNDGLPKSWMAAVLLITLWVMGMTVLAGLFFMI